MCREGRLGPGAEGEESRLAPYHILAPWERGWALLRRRGHRTLSPGCQVPDLPFILGVFTHSHDTSPTLTHCSSSLTWLIHVGLSLSLISSTQESHSQRLRLLVTCSFLYAFNSISSGHPSGDRCFSSCLG